jgi:hypothetical protein
VVSRGVTCRPLVSDQHTSPPPSPASPTLLKLHTFRFTKTSTDLWVSLLAPLTGYGRKPFAARTSALQIAAWALWRLDTDCASESLYLSNRL